MLNLWTRPCGLWLTLFALLAGCATAKARPLPGGGGSPRAMIASAVMGRVVEVDAFEQVLLLAGLDNQGDLPPREAPLTPEDAALYDLLLDKPVTLPRFAPRLVTASLLREVMEAEEDSPLPGRDPATGDRLTNP